MFTLNSDQESPQMVESIDRSFDIEQKVTPCKVPDDKKQAAFEEARAIAQSTIKCIARAEAEAEAGYLKLASFIAAGELTFAELRMIMREAGFKASRISEMKKICLSSPPILKDYVGKKLGRAAALSKARASKYPSVPDAIRSRIQRLAVFCAEANFYGSMSFGEIEVTISRKGAQGDSQAKAEPSPLEFIY